MSLFGFVQFLGEDDTLKQDQQRPNPRKENPNTSLTHSALPDFSVSAEVSWLIVDPLPASETELLSTSKTWIIFKKEHYGTLRFGNSFRNDHWKKMWIHSCFVFFRKKSHNCINFWCFLRLSLSTTNHSNHLLHLELRMDASHIQPVMGECNSPTPWHAWCNGPTWPWEEWLDNGLTKTTSCNPRKAFWEVGLGGLFPVSQVKLDAEFEMIRMHLMPWKSWTSAVHG